MRQNLIIRWTTEREKKLEAIRDKLRTSNRDIEKIHGAPTNAAIVDEALKALERELDIQEDEAKWDESFAKSQDFLEQLADEALAAYKAGLTEDLDPDNDPDFQ